MKTVIAILLTLALTAPPLYAVAQPLPPDQTQPTVPPTPAQEQPEVLTSGPVHEAFAEPVNLQVQQGLVAPVQPPPNIAEAPPTEGPQGANYVWVPGYWAWDSTRNNYIWVSACWRAAPPGMYWVPGYWSQVTDGWEWVAGFWAPVANQEIEYLPPPPAIESIPPANPPSPDYIWVPPCWYWNQTTYILRPGYWLNAQPNWVWVPSHYIWTPRGYVFVAGHWDYVLDRRGVLFAPVYFPRGVYMRAGFTYTPSIVVNIGNLTFSLFTYPRYCHYYFGDYYDNVYLSIGIYPWFETERYHTWYDPIYRYDRWRYRRSEPHWQENLRHEYDLRRENRNLRPARTYHEMETRLAKLPEQQRSQFHIAQPLTTYTASKTSPMKFEHISNKTRNEIVKKETSVRKFGEQRHRWESPQAAPKTGQPAVEHKGAVAPPTEHKGPAVTPQVERREPVTTTPERKAPVVTPPAERKAPAVTPPTEHKERAAPPAEHKGPETQPAEQKRATPPAETKAPYVPPRQVHITKPEKVKVPTPPIVGEKGKAEKGPPPNPSDERKERGSERNQPERGQPKGQEKQKKK